MTPGLRTLRKVISRTAETNPTTGANQAAFPIHLAPASDHTTIRVMEIVIASPAGSVPGGNSKTASSWAQQLTQLGHTVRLSGSPDAQAPDLLITMHAEKSHEALVQFKNKYPATPAVVALTGTDLYPELSAVSLASLRLASRVVVLQDKALQRLPADFRARAHVIYCAAQTAPLPAEGHPRKRGFSVCVVGHLRSVKAPLHTARASRLLGPESEVYVLHAGAVLEERYRELIRREEAENPRYRWLGPLETQEAQQLITSSDLLSHTSSQEGGGSVLGEALMAGTPIVASRNDATTSLLGDDYPGLFSFGDTAALATLLSSCETSPPFLRSLLASAAPHLEKCSGNRALRCWRDLLGELFPDRPSC